MPVNINRGNGSNKLEIKIENGVVGRRSRADLSPERLEFRQQQDREQHSQARAVLTPEQFESLHNPLKLTRANQKDYGAHDKIVHSLYIVCCRLCETAHKTFSAIIYYKKNIK